MLSAICKAERKALGLARAALSQPLWGPRGSRGVAEGWPRGGQAVAISLQVPRVLQNTPYLLGSALSPFRHSFTTPVQPAKLSVQGVTCCLLLSQKFTSSFFIPWCQIPGVKRGFHDFIWNCKPVLSLKRCFYRKISTAANFPKSQTIITHLVLDRGFFWIFPPDPMIKPTWFEIEDSFISPWQLSLLLPTILPNLFKQHPAIKATWQAFKALG